MPSGHVLVAVGRPMDCIHIKIGDDEELPNKVGVTAIASEVLESYTQTVAPDKDAMVLVYPLPQETVTTVPDGALIAAIT